MISGVDTQLECLQVSVNEIPYSGCSCDILSALATREVPFYNPEDGGSLEAYPDSTNSTVHFTVTYGGAQELVTMLYNILLKHKSHASSKVPEMSADINKLLGSSGKELGEALAAVCENIRVGEMELEVSATWGTMSGKNEGTEEAILEF